jgi:hypothetical protein
MRRVLATLAKTFPVRFPMKFGKLWASAKRSDDIPIDSYFTAVRQAFFDTRGAESSVFSRALVCTLPTAQRRMVSERTI